jgi:hypothetical protein
MIGSRSGIGPAMPSAAPAGGGERDQLGAAIVGVGTALVHVENMEVRFRGQTRKNLLTASISAFDAKATSDARRKVSDIPADSLNTVPRSRDRSALCLDAFSISFRDRRNKAIAPHGLWRGGTPHDKAPRRSKADGRVSNYFFSTILMSNNQGWGGCGLPPWIIATFCFFPGSPVVRMRRAAAAAACLRNIRAITLVAAAPGPRNRILLHGR